MDARLIAVAIPIFFLLIGIERFLLRGWKDPAYRLHDAIADLSCGIGQQTLQVFLYVVELGVYTWIFSHLRVHTFSSHAVLSWVLLVLLVDVAYYWFHRASHRVNFLWAIHGVHHQSEEYNLAVALRQGWLEPLAISPFHWPLALLGFPPAMFFAVFTLHTLWQFWPHTRGIGRLGFIDRVMNSPANHRCHHAINPRYIDTNYGGFLIVWDRLFGTWVQESEPPAYGTVKPLLSWNALWAQLSYWKEIGTLVRACPTWRDKLQTIVRPPEWRPATLGGPVTIPDVDRTQQRRYAVPASKWRDVYVSVAFVIVTLASPLLAQAPARVGWGAKTAMAVWIVASLVAISGIVERRRWSRSLEVACVLATPIVAWLFFGVMWAAVIAAGVALVQLVAFAIVSVRTARAQA